MSDDELTVRDILKGIGGDLEELGNIAYQLERIADLLEAIVGSTDGGRVKFLRNLDIARDG